MKKAYPATKRVQNSEGSDVDQLTRPPKCPICGSSLVWKDGLRKTDAGPMQRWLCRNCGYRFTDPNHKKRVNHILIRQVCETLADGSKNLVKVEARKKQAAGATSTQLFNFAWELKKEGLKETSIQTYELYLKRLVKRGADLLDPETVKEVIAKQNWNENTRTIAVKAYSKFLEVNKGSWKPPKTRHVRRLPFIPLERELDQLIGGAYQKLAVLLQLLKETGIRSGEAWRLEWTDIDFKANTILLNNPEKEGEPRQLKISSVLQAMLNRMPKEEEHIFSGNLCNFRRTFRKYRKRMAQKLQNSRLNRISFHTFRHWKATTEYHRTKDLLHVMRMLGHKDIKTTMIYTHLVNFEGDDYHTATSDSLKEDEELLKTGFEYVTERDGVKIYRKRK